jgi:hypothetical protein
MDASRTIASGTIAPNIVHKYHVHYNKHSPNAVNWFIYGFNS